MGTQTVSDSDFNVLQFEKQLINLKDSQEAINNCCQWCLQNRAHHKKIVNSWLNVLKRVKVEQRLILFYLANDVVQYSKRRNFDYVESWGIALQKATTMVRDEKVKHKILRIFKIWEQRCVYNEEFISDLCGLLSVLPSAPKNDEPHEFQPHYVINKIKTCSKLENDTDIKLKLLKEHNPKIQIDDGLITSLKDRAHVDDVEKEIEVYIKHMEDYINALKLEIKNRITVISVLKQAETQLEADRKDVKVVANAYKMFGTRVKTFQRKLDEHKQTLSSPIPSPDINAPSPSPDSDIELPDEPVNNDVLSVVKEVAPADYNPKAELQYSASYYTPAPTNDTSTNITTDSFLSTNGFSSFMGSETFNLENFNSSLFSNISNFTNSNDSATDNAYTSPPPMAVNPPPPLPVAAPSPQPAYGYNASHVPLLPPPMPPFSKSDMDFGSTTNYEASYTTAAAPPNFDNTYTTSSYETGQHNYETSDPAFPEDTFEPPLGANPYPPSDEYNPEEDVQTWEPDAGWNGVQPPVADADTPESPPMFEKEGYSDPVEYHDILASGPVDVDHRVIPSISNEMEDSMGSLGVKDVDHRNLISLTGSPGHSNSQNSVPDSLWNQTDQDYRIPAPTAPSDQDYRLGFNIDQLKLPPPPPPPPKFIEEQEDFAEEEESPPDSPEHMDMDMSDDEGRQPKNENLKILTDGPATDDQPSFLLEPPPPLPELLEDVDANNFLDELSNDINEFGNGEEKEENPPLLMPPPPMMHFNNLVGPPLMPPPPMNSSLPPMNTSMPPPPPLHPPPMMPGLPLMPPPNPWMSDEDQGEPFDGQGPNEENQWLEDGFSELDSPTNTWMGPPMFQPNMPPNSPGFRGRGNNRGNFVKRGRGRGSPNFGPNFNRGGSNFRDNGNFNNFNQNNFRGGRGGPRGNRGFFPRGNFRGNFQRGGF